MSAIDTFWEFLAVAVGLQRSGRIITSAALIMIAVFIGFAFAGMPLVAQLGVACAVAIAVDATVVRLVLVPALMAMFDEWNWWLPRSPMSSARSRPRGSDQGGVRPSCRYRSRVSSMPQTAAIR